MRDTPAHSVRPEARRSSARREAGLTHRRQCARTPGAARAAQQEQCSAACAPSLLSASTPTRCHSAGRPSAQRGLWTRPSRLGRCSATQRQLPAGLCGAHRRARVRRAARRGTSYYKPVLCGYNPSRAFNKPQRHAANDAAKLRSVRRVTRGTGSFRSDVGRTGIGHVPEFVARHPAPWTGQRNVTRAMRAFPPRARQTGDQRRGRASRAHAVRRAAVRRGADGLTTLPRSRRHATRSSHGAPRGVYQRRACGRRAGARGRQLAPPCRELRTAAPAPLEALGCTR